MSVWHRLGEVEEIRARVPFATRIDRHTVAVFHFQGAFRVIGNGCHHKGGPLAEGALRDEYVVCPWHGWEYSLITGRGPEGYDEEQVPVFAVEERDGEVFVATPPASPRKLLRHKTSHLLEKHPKPVGAPPRVLGISTTVMDGALPRFSTSEALLERALEQAGELGADTRLVRLRELSFRPCEGNYSKAARACTWPCAITERDPDDQLDRVYEGLVHWGDVVLVATSIRWGAASSLYFKMAERLNCIQNQITTHDRMLIQGKVAGFVITGGQDNVQAVAGSLLVFWAELGFVFPPFPFIAHTRGWDAEDMEENVRQVKASDGLRAAARELASRALAHWKVLDHHREELERPMEKGGRKAQRLGTGPTRALPVVEAG
jgi:nitrite reductase/ring-hydroxylating ferredoxin subunit/multimeric flavodoxin WrbA